MTIIPPEVWLSKDRQSVYIHTYDAVAGPAIFPFPSCRRGSPFTATSRTARVVSLPICMGRPSPRSSGYRSSCGPRHDNGLLMYTLTPQKRGERMGRVRGRDTKPEMLVRRLAHAMGYRFRLHRRDPPGAPDLVFPTRRKVIFVHGCFWYRHPNPSCKLARMPKSRLDWSCPGTWCN